MALNPMSKSMLSISMSNNAKLKPLWHLCNGDNFSQNNVKIMTLKNSLKIGNLKK